MKSLGITGHAYYILSQDRARSLREAELIPLHPRRNRPLVYARRRGPERKGQAGALAPGLSARPRGKLLLW